MSTGKILLRFAETQPDLDPKAAKIVKRGITFMVIDGVNIQPSEHIYKKGDDAKLKKFKKFWIG